MANERIFSVGPVGSLEWLASWSTVQQHTICGFSADEGGVLRNDWVADSMSANVEQWSKADTDIKPGYAPRFPVYSDHDEAPLPHTLQH